MRFTIMQRWIVIAALGFGWLTVTEHSVPAVAQAEGNTEELSRKAKTKVAPVYPDMARRLGISGTVKVAVVVSPNGAVKSTKAVGGHPVLVNAAMDAVRQWKFEAAPTESSGIVEFKFRPQN